MAVPYTPIPRSSLDTEADSGLPEEADGTDADCSDVYCICGQPMTNLWRNSFLFCECCGYQKRKIYVD